VVKEEVREALTGNRWQRVLFGNFNIRMDGERAEIGEKHLRQMKILSIFKRKQW
jgi:hypothetical protein